MKDINLISETLKIKIKQKELLESFKNVFFLDNKNELLSEKRFSEEIQKNPTWYDGDYCKYYLIRVKLSREFMRLIFYDKFLQLKLF